MSGHTLMPGPALPENAKSVVRATLIEAVTGGTLAPAALNDLDVVAGGMEDVRSAYLLLRLNSSLYLLLERHNDDGEYAAQLYPAPTGLDPSDDVAVLRAIGGVSNDDDALTDSELIARGVLTDGGVDDVSELLNAALFGFRDQISPGALA